MLFELSLEINLNFYKNVSLSINLSSYPSFNLILKLIISSVQSEVKLLIIFLSYRLSKCF